jgi:predicted methyltransferase
MGAKSMRAWGYGCAGLAALALTACGGGEPTATNETAPAEAAAPAPGDILDAVLAGDHRSDDERARDAARHPKETLLFFGIEPDMTVVEAYPGGGWYTKVIAPYLQEGGGKLYAASWNPDGASDRVVSALAKYQETFVQNPDVYGDVELTVLEAGAPIAPAGSADAVVTFRNVHSWQGRGNAEAVFQSFYDALKPGGVLGVVEHRADGADPELPRDGSSGYAYTDDTIALAEGAGFEFDRASEVNANPADTKNHPFGVWTLPPSRRSSEIRGQEDPDFDRAKYDAIGESDRMTLRFVKPIAAEGALYE